MKERKQIWWALRITTFLKERKILSYLRVHCFPKTTYWSWCDEQLILKETTISLFPPNSTFLKYHTSQNWNRQQIQQYSKDVDITHSVSWLSTFMHRRWTLWFDPDGWEYLVHYQLLGLHGAGWWRPCSVPQSTQRIPAAASAHLGTGWTEKQDVRKSTKQTKIICEAQIILKQSLPTWIGMKGCAIRRSRGIAVLNLSPLV